MMSQSRPGAVVLDHQGDRPLVDPEVVWGDPPPVGLSSTAKVWLNDGLNP